jgi:hypothetical protein
MSMLKEKAKLINQYDTLDEKYERGELSELERQVMKETMGS